MLLLVCKQHSHKEADSSVGEELRWTILLFSVALLYSPGPHLIKAPVFQRDQQNPASLKQLNTLSLIPARLLWHSHKAAAEDGLQLRKIMHCLKPPERATSLRCTQLCPGKSCMTNNKTILPLFAQWRHLCLVSDARTVQTVLLSGGSELCNFIPLMWVANNVASSLCITTAFRYELRFLLLWSRGVEAQEKISALINLSLSLVLQNYSQHSRSQVFTWILCLFSNRLSEVLFEVLVILNPQTHTHH